MGVQIVKSEDSRKINKYIDLDLPFGLIIWARPDLDPFGPNPIWIHLGRPSFGPIWAWPHLVRLGQGPIWPHSRLPFLYARGLFIAASGGKYGRFGCHWLSGNYYM